MARPIYLTEAESEALREATAQMESNAESCGEEAAPAYLETVRHLNAMMRRVQIVKFHRRERGGQACRAEAC
jgi:hypothetical protein